MLTQTQIDQFWSDGVLAVPNAVTPAQLDALNTEITGWVEESRAHSEPFGPPTLDDRPRFDMGIEHTADKPALRRVNNPSDISDTYMDVMRNASMTDMVNQLIGPNLKFHHCKINLKLPGSDTTVHYHQDFLFTPHTNDNVVTALLMLDDVTEENGCLRVVPGSHRGPMLSLYQDGNFVGAVSGEEEERLLNESIPVTGKAGSVCLMHTRLAHGSAPNCSDRSRNLYICVYSAADAFPLARNPMENPNEGMILRGEATRTARLSEAMIELPEQPKSASFFTVQGQKSAVE
ncbi:MAG: restriction endonuclease subunit S [Rhodospirillaceae bacterium]|jgi:hypothetical protein|nr:restriction endonuclease subunit S [Rhodospirillaceae bacterium]